MVSLVIFAIGTFVTIVYMSPSTKPNQDERIYLRATNYQSSFEGYVKISDMKPNSFGVFMYPDSYNYSDNANAYQRFLLIRLPAWLGGDKDDISSYRAYSMLDLDSHCMLRYWPQDGRQKIQDVCHFESYRLIDGASYFFGIKSMAKPVEDALPQLDLGVDTDGYIHVKIPTWTVDKNGLIGDGKHLSKEQILKNSEQLLLDYAKTSKNNIQFPLELNSSTFLIDIVPSIDGTQFSYTSSNPSLTNLGLDVIFCNCTGTAKNLHLYGSADKYLQAWNSGNVTIYASPYGDDPENMNDYVFQFFEKGYHIVFYPQMGFSDGMILTLDNFFNGTKLSDLEQIPVDNG
ncbi:MAG: hypothetical protein ACREAT_03135 [Nitrosotalea sp.]